MGKGRGVRGRGLPLVGAALVWAVLAPAGHARPQGTGNGL